MWCMIKVSMYDTVDCKHDFDYKLYVKKLGLPMLGIIELRLDHDKYDYHIYEDNLNMERIFKYKAKNV